jgi:hypothetical protein
VVDELATIPLNLWAQQHAYVKLRAQDEHERLMETHPE